MLMNAQQEHTTVTLMLLVLILSEHSPAHAMMGIPGLEYLAQVNRHMQLDFIETSKKFHQQNIAVMVTLLGFGYHLKVIFNENPIVILI